MMEFEDKDLVRVFMEAQAAPEGRMFSENVLAGIRAALAHAGPQDAKDAARYRWLRRRLVSWFPGPNCHLSGDALDQKIDALTK
jgi:hypothetical protein